MPSRHFKGFKSVDAEAYEQIRRRGLKKITQDFPSLLVWEGTQGCEERVHATPNALVGARLTSNRANLIALKFYKDVLRDNHVLRQKCENRDIFDLTFAIWKDEERQDGRNHMDKLIPYLLLVTFYPLYCRYFS
jgi:hypothetical protein